MSQYVCQGAEHTPTETYILSLSICDYSKLAYRSTFVYLSICLWASLVAQMVKHLPAMQETWVRSLGWEDPLEKEMATHSSTLAWKIPRTEEPGSLQSMGLQRIEHNRVTSRSFFTICL